MYASRFVLAEPSVQLHSVRGGREQTRIKDLLLRFSTDAETPETQRHQPFYCPACIPGTSSPPFESSDLKLNVQPTCVSLQAHPEKTYLSPNDLSKMPPVLFSPHYSSRREVVLRNSLPPGRYIIIPSTSDPNQQGEFLLRVLTEQENISG